MDGGPVTFLHFKDPRSGGGKYPFPDSYRCTLYWSTHVPKNATLSSSDYNKYHVFRTNHPFDPDFSAGLGQYSAKGMDVLQLIYRHYFVRKCWIKVSIVRDGTVQTGWHYMMMIPYYVDSEAPAALMSKDIMALSYPLAKFVPMNDYTKTRWTATQKWTPEYAWPARRQIEDPENWSTRYREGGTGRVLWSTPRHNGMFLGVVRNNEPAAEPSSTMGMTVEMWFDTIFATSRSSVIAGQEALYIPIETWLPTEGQAEDPDEEGYPTLLTEGNVGSGAIRNDVFGAPDA